MSLTTDTTAPTRLLGGSRQTVEIAVAYVNRPDTLTFWDLPATITVAVDGPAGDIGPLTIDLGHSRPGSNYHLLLPTQVPTPPGITVQAFKPAMLVLEADLTVASGEQARMDAIGWGHRLAIQPARQPWEMWKLYQANAGVPSRIQPMPERVGPGFATQEACQRELAEGLPQIPIRQVTQAPKSIAGYTTDVIREANRVGWKATLQRQGKVIQHQEQVFYCVHAAADERP